MNHFWNSALVHHPLGMLWPLTPVALVVTAVLGSLRRRGEPPRWLRRLSLWLWSLGLLGCVMAVVGEVACAGLRHEEMLCRSEIKELGLGVLMYTQDWDERMPPLERWLDAATPYGEARLGARPCLAQPGSYPYAMNAALGSIDLGTIDLPAETVMLAEHPATRANETTMELSPRAFRHRGSANVGFTDVTSGSRARGDQRRSGGSPETTPQVHPE